jgi:hypothetical protein
MAKIPNKPVVITADAIAQAIATTDDFGHEMRVKAILKRGAHVQHGWAYLDPIEGKPRQFDFRARVDHREHAWRIQMAVESKNLAAEAPLIISGTARTKEEAFHHFVVSETNQGGPRVMSVWRDQEIYPQGRFAGKNALRLRPDRGFLVPGPDSDIYGRWAQALASADELCKEAIAATDHLQRQVCTVVLPVVVVPDGTLWMAEYREDGTMTGPVQSDSTTLFVNHEIVVVPRNHWMKLGHVHFFTLKGLEGFMMTLTAKGASWEEWFPSSAEHYAPPVH